MRYFLVFIVAFLCSCTYSDSGVDMTDFDIVCDLFDEYEENFEPGDPEGGSRFGLKMGQLYVDGALGDDVVEAVHESAKFEFSDGERAYATWTEAAAARGDLSWSCDPMERTFLNLSNL